MEFYTKPCRLCNDTGEVEKGIERYFCSCEYGVYALKEFHKWFDNIGNLDERKK